MRPPSHSPHLVKEEKESQKYVYDPQGTCSSVKTASLTGPFGSQYGGKVISPKKRTVIFWGAKNKITRKIYSKFYRQIHVSQEGD